MDWSAAASKVMPFIVRIRTQQKSGTGFVFWQNSELCCIATANHVIKNANLDGWEQPIYIDQPNGLTLRVNPANRRIQSLNEDNNGDSASILIRKSGLQFPPDCLSVWDFCREIPVGTEVGWLGYPQVVDEGRLNPCFFSGSISCHFSDLQQYAIDGVAIHGVSGAPVFCKGKKNGPHVIGTISSYFPNRIPVQGGVESWPGIALSHSFSAFESVLKDLDGLSRNDEEVAQQTT
jgi:hypothetical protein